MRRLRSAIWLLAALVALAIPAPSQAQVLTISIAPPELPVYEQPELPAPGYIWTPGYWAYGPEGYFWVPGTWIEPPRVGLLWTPGYWGWHDGYYGWNAGYWGPHIGFYGGVNYGFGYGGVGYEGGRWNNGVFAYNRTVNNFGGVSVTNVYNQTVVVNPNAARTSFNGGTGGVTAQPTPQEQAAAQEQHVAATPAQAQQEHVASTNRSLLATENHGHPAIAATSRPGVFTGKGVVAAREVRPNAVPATAAGAAKPLGAKPGANQPLDRAQANRGQGGPPKPAAAGVPPPKPAAEARPAAPRPQVAAAKPPVPKPPAPKPAAPKPAAKPTGPPPKDHH